MRIAFVTNLYPPIQTGSAYWTREAAAVLASRGHHVIVITCGPGVRAEVAEEVAGVYVYRMPAMLRFPKWMLFLNFDQFYLMASRRNGRRFREILKSERIDVIHQAGHLLDSMLLSRSAGRALGIPVVCSLHTRIGHPTSALYDRVMRFTDRFVLGPWLMRGFAQLIAMDQVLIRYYEHLYRVDTIEIVPVCVEDRIVDCEPALLADGPSVRIVSVGHVTAMRDRRELLAAVAELKEHGLPITLDIAGKVLTDITPRIIRELRLEDTVRLLGEVPREELFAILRDASLEVHWIDIQGVGSAAVEAMALGLPVAAWAPEDIYGDVPLRHLENIVLIDPHDHTALVGILEQLARDGALRQLIGANARALVRAHLTWGSVAPRLEAIYAGALATSGRAE